MMKIDALIPHRAPFMLVSGFLGIDGAGRGHSYYHIPHEGILMEEGTLTPGGLVEHMAQSVAAYSGYMTWLQGIPYTPRILLLAGVDNLVMHRTLRAGERIDTLVHCVASLDDLSLFEVQSAVWGAQVGSCRIKVGAPKEGTEK